LARGATDLGCLIDQSIGWEIVDKDAMKEQVVGALVGAFDNDKVGSRSIIDLLLISFGRAG
jgi:hypothetical protein